MFRSSVICKNKKDLVFTHLFFTFILHLLITQDLNWIKKITNMWRRWGTPHNFLLVFINELWKTLKNQNLEKMKKNCWRYHHSTHVYQKPQSYDIQFQRYGEKTKFWKNVKSIWRCHHFKLCNKKHNQMYAYSDMEWGRYNLLSF